MTSQESLDVREALLINGRCRLDYQKLPQDVRESADQAIDALQNARPFSAKLYQPLRGSLAGVDEVSMILDAGLKKSTRGRSIPKWQVERLEARHQPA